MESNLTADLNESEFRKLAQKGCSFHIAMRPAPDYRNIDHYESMELPFVVINTLSLAYSNPYHLVISDKDFKPTEKNNGKPVQTTWIYGWVNKKPMFFNVYMDGMPPYPYLRDRYETFSWRVHHWQECNDAIAATRSASPLRVIIWEEGVMMSLPVQLPYAMDNGDVIVQTQLFWFLQRARAIPAQFVIDTTNSRYMDLGLLHKRQWMPLRKVKLLCQEKF